MSETTTTSHGLLGLPHYRNSRVSMSMAEPVYQNLYVIQISLPPALKISTQTTNLLLEEVTKINGLATNKMPASIKEQHFKYATRSFVSGKPNSTTLDLTLDFEVNLMYDSSTRQPNNFVVKTLRKWSDLEYDPLTGREGLKRDYTAPEMVITVFDRAYTPFWQWTCYDIFPTKGIPDPGLEGNSDEILRITGYGFRCDHWDEVQL